MLNLPVVVSVAVALLAQIVFLPEATVVVYSQPSIVKSPVLKPNGSATPEAEFASADRVFKLSGRYQVTDKFDIKKFDNAKTKGKYVFKKRQASWIPQEDTGVDHLLQTRLWSFTPDLFVDTINLFQTIINNMFEVLNKQRYIDVEHSMAKFIPEDKLVEFVEKIKLIFLEQILNNINGMNT